MRARRQLEDAVPAALYAAAVIASRQAGFHAMIPWGFYQLLDARTLREHPLASLCLMHHQPPGLNALLAGVLAVAARFGCAPESIVAGLFLTLGLVAVVVVDRLVRALTGSRLLAAFAVLFLLTDPAYHLEANLFFYEFLLYVLHLLLLASAFAYLVHGRGLLRVGLLVCAITSTRTLFHPLWAFGFCGLLVLLRERTPGATVVTDRRPVLALVVLMVGLLSCWPLKNRIVFGRGFYATMSAYSVARGLPGCGSRDFNDYLATGRATPEAMAMAERPLAVCGADASSVILSPTKSDGSRNWNHVALIAAADGFERCGVVWRLHEPGAWLLRAAGQYAMWMRGGYLNPYDQVVTGPFTWSYRAYTTRYDRLLYADLRPLAERLFPGWALHGAAMVGGKPVPYTLFGFVVFPATVALVLARWLRGPWSPRHAVVALALFSISWALLGACATDGIEGNRMRFSITGLFAVVLAYALHAPYELTGRAAGGRADAAPGAEGGHSAERGDPVP